MKQRTPNAATFAAGSALALIVLCVAWEIWLAPLRPGGTAWAIKALPLCVALPGLIRQRLYTFRWICLLVWLYVTEGLVRATSDAAPSRWYAAGEVALALLLFVACVAHIRLQTRAAR